SRFFETAADINQNYQAAISGGALDPTPFGQLLHEGQDFYSQTNWGDLGQTGLVDAGRGAWGCMAPVTIRPGAMLVEGTAPSPFGPGSSVVPVGTGGFTYEVVTGETDASSQPITYEAVVSGTPASTAPNTPLGAIPTTLAKDSLPSGGTPDQV